MKCCTTCGASKAPTDFQIRRASKDGLTASCKECLKERDRARNGQEHRLAMSRAYQSTAHGAAIHLAANKKYRQKNKQATAAQNMVNNAIRDGKLLKWPACALHDCDSKPEAHHPDYSAPLDVVWLCDRHHKDAHNLTRAILRGEA